MGTFLIGLTILAVLFVIFASYAGNQHTARALNVVNGVVSTLTPPENQQLMSVPKFIGLK